LNRFNEKANYLMNGTGLQGFTKNNLTKSIRSAGILLAIPLLCAGLMAQQKKSSGAVEGQRIFTGNCAACHGLDGGGGERGPDIAHRREVQRRTDQVLFRTVHDGIPTAGMPSFRGLGTPGIQAVIKYLRELQSHGKAEPLPGDPKNGRELFAGKAACSSCHMVKGEGGFIASDLSGYASERPVTEIREAIVAPEKNPIPRKSAMVVTTAGGKTYRGVVRNEDNFSLQMQTMDGMFHSFNKAELQKFEYESQPLMPGDYGVKLTQGEINDLISYLMNASSGDKHKPVRGEEE
jgi:putative heme-binding domain-containing protein